MQEGITIIGLGPGAAGHLSLEGMELLKSDAQVILRTKIHPTVDEIEKQGVKYTSCDDLYEAGSDFNAVYEGVARRVVEAATAGPVVYAVPGSPLVAEKTVLILRRMAKEAGISLGIKPAMSFLDLAYVALEIDPIAGLRIIDASDFTALADAGKYPLMVTQVYSRLVAGDMKLALMDVLDDDTEIVFLRNLGLPEEECRSIKVYELDRQPEIDYLTSVYIPAVKAEKRNEKFGVDGEELLAVKAEEAYESESADVDFADVDFADAESADENESADAEFADENESADESACADSSEEGIHELTPAEALLQGRMLTDFDIAPLCDVMKVLRMPGGCPWDIEQDFYSIRANLIEECYEYIEALNKKDQAGMQEELGDILMQVVFHATMAEEKNMFDMQQVIDGVTDKLIVRHPHVFGDVKVSGSDDVLKNWESIKAEEKPERKKVLDGVYRGFPALVRAYKIQKKVAKVGFDWKEIAPVREKVLEEIGEFKEAVASGDRRRMEEELGDVFFSLVNYARHLDLDSETALDACNDRFQTRFEYIESKCEEAGEKIEDKSLDDLNKLWSEAKVLELAKQRDFEVK